MGHHSITGHQSARLTKFDIGRTQTHSALRHLLRPFSLCSPRWTSPFGGIGTLTLLFTRPRIAMSRYVDLPEKTWNVYIAHWSHPVSWNGRTAQLRAGPPNEWMPKVHPKDPELCAADINCKFSVSLFGRCGQVALRWGIWSGYCHDITHSISIVETSQSPWRSRSADFFRSSHFVIRPSLAWRSLWQHGILLSYFSQNLSPQISKMGQHSA
jgi:hypothetical protein